MEPIRQVFAVCGVLLLMAAALWWLRRKGLARYGGRARREHALQAVERVMLSPQHSLHLVRLSRRGWLVAVSPAGCAVLDQFDWTALESRLPDGIQERA